MSMAVSLPDITVLFPMAAYVSASHARFYKNLYQLAPDIIKLPM